VSNFDWPRHFPKLALARHKHKRTAQKELIKVIQAMPNKDLLEDVIELAAGDYWEGDFTEEGTFHFIALLYELKCRLSEWMYP